MFLGLVFTGKQIVAFSSREIKILKNSSGNSSDRSSSDRFEKIKVNIAKATA